jgi:hypothetical protein
MVSGRMGFAPVPRGAVDFLKYPCTVDGTRFEKEAGFSPAHDLRATLGSLATT